MRPPVCCRLLSQTAHVRLESMLLREALVRLVAAVQTESPEACTMALQQARRALATRPWWVPKSRRPDRPAKAKENLYGDNPR